MRLWNKKPVPAMVGLLWVGLVAAGLGILWRHEQTPGIAAAPPAQWPNQSRIQRATDRATLVMLAHPRCPCTRASIGELSKLMAQVQGRVESHVLFHHPSGFPPEWVESDLWRNAAAIPGVIAEHDLDGAEAHCFRSETSGQVLLYDAAGHLLFSGGITGSRGHAGDNAGRSAVISLLLGNSGGDDRHLVFGCSLFDSHPLNQKALQRASQEPGQEPNQEESQECRH